MTISILYFLLLSSDKRDLVKRSYAYFTAAVVLSLEIGDLCDRIDAIAKFRRWQTFRTKFIKKKTHRNEPASTDTK